MAGKPHKAKPSSGGTRKYGRNKRSKNPCNCLACRDFRNKQ